MHRKLLRYSMTQVAQLLDLQSTAPLSQWEKGIVMPSVLNLIKLSLLYRTYPNELYPEYFSDLMKLLREKEQELLNYQ